MSGFSPRLFGVLLFGLLVYSLVSTPIQAEERSAAVLLPDSTVFYGEIAQPRQLLSMILEHPLRQSLESVDGYRQALESQQYRQLTAAVTMVEKELDKNWPEILGSLTAGGLSVAYDAGTNGLAILAKADDATTPAKLRDWLLRMVPGVPKTMSYRDVRVHALEELRFAVVQQWLVVTNQDALGRHIVDRLLGDSGEALAATDRFRNARQQISDQSMAWLYVNVHALRDRGIARALTQGRSENPAAEFLFGGMLSNLQRTGWITAGIELHSKYVRLTLASPHDPAWVDSARDFYFGPKGTGVAPELVTLEDTVLTLSAYRNIGEMWLHADDLFDQEVVDGFAQADSALSTLFSGKDFGEEVLGVLRPEIQLIVTRQNFGDRLPQPAIKLPAFATVFKMRAADEIRDDFRRTFQSLMGFLNVIGAMNAQPQLDFHVEKGPSRQILTSHFVAESSQEESRQAPIQFNFSPGVALVDDRMILSSDTNLARSLSHTGGDGDGGREDGGTDVHVNTRARLDAGVLHDILVDNRSQLIARNMLEEGNSKDEAASQIDALLQILRLFDQAALRLATADGKLELQLAIDFKVN